LGPEKSIDTIPQCIGAPWLKVSNMLGIAPALTHAAVDLYNWELKDPSLPFDIDNLKSNYLMTGEKDEEWFYLIMVAIEGVSGPMIEAIYEIMNNDPSIYQLIKHFNTISTLMLKNVAIINRMQEHCTPEFFFNKLRIYLGGSDKKEYFPDGFKIRDTKHEPIKYSGGSAAQSSLIQALDIFLDVKHDGIHKEFLDSMHQYMPEKHRDFLRNLKEKNLANPIKDRIRDCDELCIAYKKMLETHRKFRQCHFTIVHKYIIAFIPDKNTDKKFNDTNIHQDKGTGGTEPDEFLQQLIDNTVSSRDACDTLGTHDSDSDDDTDKTIYFCDTVQIVPIIFMLIFMWFALSWQ